MRDYRTGVLYVLRLAAILLATFTVVSGLIAPRAARPKKRKEKKISAPSRPDRPHLDLVEPSSA